jgi:hypothetical protein
MADWAMVLDTLQATVLPIWDAWCPDDGRPAALLAAGRAYVAAPTEAARVHLVIARNMARGSEHLAYQWAGFERDAQQLRAWVAVLVLLVCSQAVVRRTRAYQPVIQRLLEQDLGLPALALPEAPVI